MARELVWPYVISDSNPTVSGYLEWAKNQTDELYKLKYEQVYSLIIHCYRCLNFLLINTSINCLDLFVFTGHNKFSRWS